MKSYISRVQALPICFFNVHLLLGKFWARGLFIMENKNNEEKHEKITFGFHLFFILKNKKNIKNIKFK